jgi:hypothetical protein
MSIGLGVYEDTPSRMNEKLCANRRQVGAPTFSTPSQRTRHTWEKIETLKIQLCATPNTNCKTIRHSSTRK